MFEQVHTVTRHQSPTQWSPLTSRIAISYAVISPDKQNRLLYCKGSNSVWSLTLQMQWIVYLLLTVVCYFQRVWWYHDPVGNHWTRTHTSPMSVTRCSVEESVTVLRTTVTGRNSYGATSSFTSSHYFPWCIRYLGCEFNTSCTVGDQILFID